MKLNYCLIPLITLLLFPSLSYAGTTMQYLSKTITYIQLDKIEEQIKEARKASQRAMSKEELEKIKAQADEVLRKGSMVFTGAYIYEAL